jgi:predicted lipoprotein with Yx(FWY)xxD motif
VFVSCGSKRHITIAVTEPSSQSLAWRCFRIVRPAILLAGAFTGAALVATACGGYSTGGGGSPYGGASPGAATNSVGVNSTQLGQFLVDANGRTLYLFEADTGKSSTCYDACAQAWPPALTSGQPQAGNGVTASELSTVTRRDNSSQIAYNGHPLYYYVGDAKRGDTTGQGLNQFGAPWYVVSPSGSKIDNS